jgi:hypothetical protein
MQFGSDDRFLREAFEDQESFFLFLNVELPPSARQFLTYGREESKIFSNWPIWWPNL